MKKNILMAVLCFFSVCALFSQEYESLELLNGYFDFSSARVDVYISPDAILFDGEKIERNLFRLEKNGYYYLKDNIVIFDQFHHLMAWHNTTLNMHPLVETQIGYAEDATYSASSYLTEKLSGKKIAYTPNNLNNIIAKPYINYKHIDYFIPGPKTVANAERFFIWNEEHKPWASKSIGSTVTANFDDEVNCVFFLNGYVDPYHPDYYKKNSRIKDVKVTDETNGIDYFFTLEDEVKIQSFQLNSPTSKVTMTVLSVYKGEKYEDICLSLFAGTYNHYFYTQILSELSYGKEKVEEEHRFYEWMLKKTPENIEHDLDIIMQDWVLYCALVYDRVKKEFGEQYLEPSFEIYKDADFSVNLEVHDNSSWIYFCMDEKIKSISYKFNGPNVKFNALNLIFPEHTAGTIAPDIPSRRVHKVPQKDGRTAYYVHTGTRFEHFILNQSVWLEVEYTDGSKKEVFVPEEGIAKVRRFGELLISVCDLK